MACEHNYNDDGGMEMSLEDDICDQLHVQHDVDIQV
jgi:hypothetical protein